MDLVARHAGVSAQNAMINGRLKSSMSKALRADTHRSRGSIASSSAPLSMPQDSFACAARTTGLNQPSRIPIPLNASNAS
jgi:hypothetical protein